MRTGFPLNAAASLLLAVGLIAMGFSVFARLRPFVLLAALGLELGSIAILVITRYRSVFGWIEKDDWGTDPKRTIVVEILAVVALLAVIVFDRDRTRRDHVGPEHRIGRLSRCAPRRDDVDRRSTSSYRRATRRARSR